MRLPSLVAAALISLLPLGSCGSQADAPDPAESEEQGGGAEVAEEAPAAEAIGAQAEEPSEENAADELPRTIDGLVERFSNRHGVWANGGAPRLEAAEGASAQTVLEEAFTRMSFDEGPVSEFEVLEERRVQIDDEEYLAVRISTNLGPKIVLMRYYTSWWVRAYEGS